MQSAAFKEPVFENTSADPSREEASEYEERIRF